MHVQHLRAAQERLAAAADALRELARQNPPHHDPEVERRHPPDWAVRDLIDDIEACGKRAAQLYGERT